MSLLEPSPNPDIVPSSGNSVRPQRTEQEPLFGSRFWYAYVSHTLAMTAVSLLFRYSDFVKLWGGDEWILGRIVGIGMIGSLLMRLAQGVGIDRYGARRIWLISAFFYTVSIWCHLLIHNVHGPEIILLRIIMQTSVAGFFGASIAYISGRAPAARMAEAIGTLGTSGFVGMMLGTPLGDWIIGAAPVTQNHVWWMFFVAGSLATVSCLFASLATRGQLPPPRRKRKVPLWWLLRRYHPGELLIMGVVMGVGLGMPQAFLRPYAESLGIGKIAVFFWMYAPTAFLTRLLIRRVPERFGIRPMVLWGEFCLVASMVLFLLARNQWHLIPPAILLGIAHACLFPAVVAGGSTIFPPRYRGLGTTLMLAMFDVGNLIGAPMIGAILHLSRENGFPPYPTMFLTVAVVLGVPGMYYALRTRNLPKK